MDKREEIETNRKGMWCLLVQSCQLKRGRDPEVFAAGLRVLQGGAFLPCKGNRDSGFHLYMEKAWGLTPILTCKSRTT